MCGVIPFLYKETTTYFHAVASVSGLMKFHIVSNQHCFVFGNLWKLFLLMEIYCAQNSYSKSLPSHCIELVNRGFHICSRTEELLHGCFIPFFSKVAERIYKLQRYKVEMSFCHISSFLKHETLNKIWVTSNGQTHNKTEGPFLFTFHVFGHFTAVCVTAKDAHIGSCFHEEILTLFIAGMYLDLYTLFCGKSVCTIFEDSRYFLFQSLNHLNLWFKVLVLFSDRFQLYW